MLVLHRARADLRRRRAARLGAPAPAHAARMGPRRELREADAPCSTSLVPVGIGELLAVRKG